MGCRYLKCCCNTNLNVNIWPTQSGPGLSSAWLDILLSRIAIRLLSIREAKVFPEITNRLIPVTVCPIIFFFRNFFRNWEQNCLTTVIWDIISFLSCQRVHLFVMKDGYSNSSVQRWSSDGILLALFFLDGRDCSLLSWRFALQEYGLTSYSFLSRTTYRS